MDHLIRGSAYTISTQNQILHNDIQTTTLQTTNEGKKKRLIRLKKEEKNQNHKTPSRSGTMVRRSS